MNECIKNRTNIRTGHRKPTSAKSGSTHPIGRPIRYRRLRKHSILIYRAGLSSLRSSTCRSLHVVVKARDDVAARCALEVRRFFGHDAFLHLVLDFFFKYIFYLRPSARLFSFPNSRMPCRSRSIRTARQRSLHKTSHYAPVACQRLCASRSDRALGFGLPCIRPKWAGARGRCPSCCSPCVLSRNRFPDDQFSFALKRFPGSGRKE